MGEERRIQSAALLIYFRAHAHSGTGRPVHFGHCIVLPFVLLYATETATAAIGIAERVEVTSGSPGVLETVALEPSTYLRLHGRGVRMALQVIEQGRKPVFRYFHV